MRMTTWHLRCAQCKAKNEVLCWDTDLGKQVCKECKDTSLVHDNFKFSEASGVIGDELNGYAAKHAICNEDGSPRRFDSKTELYRALNEAGYTISGDTPKPYKVAWSGKVKEIEKAAPIFRVKREES